MIPQSLQNQRKGIIGLFFWLAAIFLFLTLAAVAREEWDSVAALASATIAVVPAIMAYDTIFQTRIDKLPQLDIVIDPTSRYQLFQLVTINSGGSAAYNIRITWLDKDPESGRPLPIPQNVYGQTVSFGKKKGYESIRFLAKGQKHFTVVGGYYEFYDRYPNEAFFLAKLTYSTSLTGEEVLEATVPVSFDEFRMTLDYHEESSLTHYRLQQLPKKLEEIVSMLGRISKKLDPEG